MSSSDSRALKKRVAHMLSVMFRKRPVAIFCDLLIPRYASHWNLVYHHYNLRVRLKCLVRVVTLSGENPQGGLTDVIHLGTRLDGIGITAYPYRLKPLSFGTYHSGGLFQSFLQYTARSDYM